MILFFMLSSTRKTVSKNFSFNYSFQSFHCTALESNLTLTMLSKPTNNFLIGILKRGVSGIDFFLCRSVVVKESAATWNW
jgi:hypothetical protein